MGRRKKIFNEQLQLTEPPPEINVEEDEILTDVSSTSIPLEQEITRMKVNEIPTSLFMTIIDEMIGIQKNKVKTEIDELKHQCKLLTKMRQIIN